MRRQDESSEETSSGAEEPKEKLVPRELTQEEREEKMTEFANLGLELLELREERKRYVKKKNDKISETEAEFRRLGEQLRTGVEMVPAQQQLALATKSRRGTKRTHQDNGAAVEP